MSQNQSGFSSDSASPYSSAASTGSQAFFIDASVPGYEALALSLGENSKVFVIENTSDAFIQIDKALASLSDPASSVHIYSHGRDGAMLLGGQWIDEAALSQSAEILQSIGESLAKGADILLYGCNTAASSLGESFIARMARLASVDVAASSNMTGSGGDWTLEKGTGDIETTPTRPGEWLGSLGAGATISGWGVLEGTANSENITGFVTNDRIYGNGGADTMAGGDGDDAYYISGSGTSGTQVIEKANEGTDTVYSMVNNFDLSGGDSTNGSAVEYVVLQAQSGMVAQSATGNKFGQTMVGNNLANNLTGMGGNDLLYGYDGDDFLDGGNGKTSAPTSGTDYNYDERNTLIGGKGDDNYIVRGTGDVVVENSNEGTDNVFSFIDYTLGANVENLTLLDGEDSISSARMGVGNALNNVLRGNSFANVLVGDAGNDTLYGSKALDTEADTLIGGVGNDAYYVYSTRDIIDDSAGNDSLYSTVNYTLGANIENLFLQGDATMGQGNTLNNRIVGNEILASNLTGGGGTDTLEGGYGNDTFNLSSSGDMVIDKGGNNTVLSSVTVDLNRFANATIQTVELTGNAAINATAQRNVATSIKGNSGNNVLVGGALNDTLDGGADGVDSLSGGLGDDVYYVRNTSTIVTEAVNAGTDVVNASVDYTLTANVENLVLQGNAKIGVGNNLSNVIDGSAINGSILHGGANSTGLAGDTLIGGTGNDQFYSYNANDSIVFGGGNDVLYVSYAVDGGADMNAAAWKAYFSARGVTLTDSVTVIYRGNPVAGSGATSGVSINGTSLATNLLGTDKNDTLKAQSDTATTLDGGKGSDSMVGSSAGDVFYVDSIGATTIAAVSLLGNVGDIVVAGAGKDTIRSSVSIDLNKGYAIGNSASTAQFSDVEVVELQGTAALSATGNLNASTTLYGNAANNSLFGGNSDDVLDGGAGADVMTGGNGNDLYYIDNAGDRVVEKAGDGTDSIKTNGISINLGAANFANVEYVENIGSVGISMTGTTGTETIIAGNSGDTLDGKGGNDNLVGGTGNDLIYYYGSEQSIDAGDGMDTLFVKNTAKSINNDAVHHFEVVQLESVAANVRAIDINASGATTQMTLIGNAGSSNLEGGSGNDVIIGGGGQDSINAGSGDDFVEISANQSGYGALDGGLGADTLSFGAGADSVAFAEDGSITQVISGKKVSVNATGFEVYSGGAGNDTLDASATTDGRMLAGGLGADVLKGGSGSDTLIADGGNDSIYTNGGHDTVKLTKDAVGSSITVMDFDAQLDTINDTELTGWSKTVTQSGADAIVTYVNPINSTQKISVIFKNTVGSDIRSGMTMTIADNGTTFSATDVASSVPWQIDVTGTGNTVSGGNLNDQMKSSGGNALNGGAGNDEIFGQAGDTLLGGTGDDTIKVSGPTTGVSIDGGEGNDVMFADSLGGATAATISGGAGDDKFYINGINASGSTTSNISGGEGNDGLYLLGSSAIMHFTGGGATEISLDSATLNGNVGTVSVSGIEYYMGTGGADSVDASGTTYKIDGSSLHYSTNGGNDTYIGGAAIDAVTVSGFNAYSAVKLVGGGDNNDASDTVSFRGNSAVGITLDTNGAVGSLTADGATVGASISGFESFDLTEQNDVFDARGYTAIGTHAASCIYGNGGDDTIKLGDVTAYYQVSAEGGDGNDSIVVGAVASDSLGTVILDGGKGSDTLTFATDKSVTLTFSDTAGPALSYYTTTTDSNGNTTTPHSPSSNVSISGFEYYKGSNSGNYFNATALSSVQGSLALEGGDGHDNFYLGNLASGQVTLAGGKGSDRFHLGSVASGASVFVDGGIDGEAKDKLGFFDQDGSTATNVFLTLDRYGNLGAVSIAGQKANITSSGLNAYTGGNGNDTIDGSAVTSVDNAEKVMILEGGSGDDLIKSGNISGGYFQLEGGLGSDTIIGGAGNDRILLGGSTYTDAGKDSITTGGGYDTLVVNALGNGVVSTITDFDASRDTLDDSALLFTGWARAVTTTAGKSGTMVTYAKDSTSFSLNFTNFTNKTFLPSVVSVSNSNFTVVSGFSGQVYGTSGAEEIDASNAGACTIYGNGGNDMIHGSAGNDSIIVKGGSDSVTVIGAGGNDTISVDGAITGGYYNLQGAGDTDYINVSAIAGGIVDLGGETIFVDKVSGGTASMAGSSVTVKDIDNASVSLAGSDPGANTNEAFYLGDIASGASVTVNGGNGIDSLFFTGSQALDLTLSDVTGSADFKIEGIDYLKGTILGDYIDASGYTANSRLTLHGGDGDDILIGGANQLLTGGQGDDLLIVTSGSTNGQTWARGGSGTDTLSLEYLGSVTADIIDSAVGSGVEGATVPTTGIRFSSGGITTLEELEVITLGNSGNNLTLAGKVASTAPAFQFGGGVDSLTLSDAGAGSVLRIKNFDSTSVTPDAIIAGDGWAYSSTSVVGSSTRLIYSKSGMADITVWLDGQYNYSKSAVGNATTLAAGSTYIGSAYEDTVSVALRGNANTYVNMGINSGGDKKEYVHITGVSDGSATHTFVGSNDNTRFVVDGSAGATMMFSDGGNGSADISLKSISIGGKTALTNTTGFTKYFGTTGADSVSVSSEAGDLWSTRHLEYETNGGNDTYRGGAGRDYVHVSGLTSSSAVVLDGGDGQNDILFFEDNKATSLTFDGNGAISQLKVGTQSISGSQFTNFERYWLDNSVNDTITATDSRSLGAGQTFEISTFGGNDSINVGDVTLKGGGSESQSCSFHLLAGDGNDTITAGKITSTGAYDSFYVDGGAGKDTYQFQASGCNAYVGESGVESDTLQFFGVDDANFSDLTAMGNNLQFRLMTDSSNGVQSLFIDGIDGTLGGSNVLKFNQENFAGDKMDLFTGQGTGQLLGGSIDLASIVSQLSPDDSNWTKLTFASSGSNNITATGKKA